MHARKRLGGPEQLARAPCQLWPREDSCFPRYLPILQLSAVMAFTSPHATNLSHKAKLRVSLSRDGHLACAVENVGIFYHHWQLYASVFKDKGL